MYDLLYGIVLLEDEVSNGVKKIFNDSYDPDKIRKAAAGHVSSTQPKKGGKINDMKIVEGKSSVNKIACEAAYLATRVRYINNNISEVPPFDVFKLIERSYAPEEE